MLSPQVRLRLHAVLQRIAAGAPVSLQERIDLQKHADRHPTVAGWLRRARRDQLGAPMDGLDRLLRDLDLGPADPDPGPDPDSDDLGDWFSGAPGWLRRS